MEVPAIKTPAYPVPEHLDDPRLRAIFDYWRSRFRGSLLPARTDIDPLQIPALLGHLTITKVARRADAIRFRYRLWGTRVTELYGRDFTGRYLDEIIIPTRVEEIQRIFEEVTATAVPHFWQIPVPVENRAFVSNRRVLLPLATDGVTVDFLLAFMVGDPR